MVGPLDALGISEGTDKGSIAMDYLRHYERILGHLREKPITLLEIGVARGASVRMWQGYFSVASIVGVDINGGAREYATERCVIEIGSQGDPDFLQTLAAKYKPDVIIDDGSHQADHILMTFKHLYPVLSSGGIYIVEDVHFHSGRWAHEHRGTANIGPHEFFLTLARVTICPQERETLTEPVPTADSVEFVRGAAIVRKA